MRSKEQDPRGIYSTDGRHHNQRDVHEFRYYVRGNKLDEFRRTLWELFPKIGEETMKRLFLLLLLSSGSLYAKPQHVFAQVGGHSVALSWVLSTDDTTQGCASPNTCSQTVYRSLGPCSGTPTFTSIATPSSSTATFIDQTVVPGTYCYAVTFTQNGLESVKDTVTVILPPFSPSGLAGQPH